MDSIEGALLLASQTPNIRFASYLRATWEKMVSWFASMTSEECTEIINDEAVPENIKKATKFGLAVFKGNGLSF